MRKFYIVEQNAQGDGGHYFNYTRVIAQAAAQRGLDVIVLSNRHFEAGYGIDGVRSVKAFDFGWVEAEWQLTRAWQPGLFAFDLHVALEETGAKSGDIVFIHTIGNEELKTLLKAVSEGVIALAGIVVHLLLRYDVAAMRASFPFYRTLFGRPANASLIGRSLVFHSDTDRLARQYGGLTGMPFGVAPIPFEQAHLRGYLASGPAVRAAGAPLTIAYVGDARREKNYHHLPQAVAKLLADPELAGKVRFVLQSNFNCEGGEEGIAAARSALEAHGADRVELVYDQMTSDDYYGLIEAADIVMVPYDAQRYASRSSGVLIEAMAAGKPVLVTRGSWMESQVDASHAVVIEDAGAIYEGLKALILGYDRFREGALKKQPAILESSSGDAFIGYLLAKTPDAEGPGAGTRPVTPRARLAGAQSFRDLLGVGGFSDLVASCGARAPGRSWSALIDEGAISPQAEPDTLDLLYTCPEEQTDGSDLLRFLKDCYLPYLEPSGVTLVVTGDIDLAPIKAALGAELPHVYATGVVENSAPLYAAARLAVLPGGSADAPSSSLFEALARGVPLVAHPDACGGQERFSELCADPSAQAFAERIRDLLASPEARLKLAGRSAALHCDVLAGDGTELPSAAPGQLVEADADLFRANRVILAWIRGFNMDEVEDCCGTEAVRSLVSEYRRLLAGRTSIYEVPMLATHPSFGLTILNCQNRPWFPAKFDAFARTLAGVTDDD